MIITISINEKDLPVHLENLEISKKVLGRVVQGAEKVILGLENIEKLIKVLEQASISIKEGGIPKLKDILDLGDDETAVGIFNISTPHSDKANAEGRIQGVPPSKI